MAKYKFTRLYELQVKDKQAALHALNLCNWDLTYLTWQGMTELSGKDRRSWVTIAKDQWQGKARGT